MTTLSKAQAISPADRYPTLHFIFLFILSFLLLFNYSCPHFSPITLPWPTYLPRSILPIVLVHGSFIQVPWLDPSPSFPHYPPPRSPLAIVRLFLVSMSLGIFCLFFSFVDYVPVKGDIIWYLSLTAWLISLSIMLSSSIHAVTKGRSSFFLSSE